MASRNKILDEVADALEADGRPHVANIVRAMRRAAPPESKHHSALMESYYAAREAQQLRAESYGLGYATETAEFYATVEPRVTFKAWLSNQADNRSR